MKGLITEAGELTFPEDSSIDELNCQLNRDGSRRRRLAVEFDEARTPSNFLLVNSVFETLTWTNVDGKAGFDFLVVQNGDFLYFYNKSTEPFSSSQLPVALIDLTAYEHAGSAGAGTAKIQGASILGNFVVTSSEINPLYLYYDEVTGEVTDVPITIRTRDFEWQGDITTYTNIDTTPSNERIYDALNAGWGGTYGPNDFTRPLTHPWYAGKDASGNYSLTEWNKVYAGSSLTGNGHFVVDFFAKQRDYLATEYELTRFQTVAAYAGRIFYAGLTSAKNGGKILFSRQLEDMSDVGKCYQLNDPVAEDFSDLLDTDGGVIVIPEASNIKKIYTAGSSLYVFAENGVWRISGVDNVFRATEYSIQRVTSTGIVNAGTFVEVEGAPIWWSKSGIHTVSIDPATGNASDQNLSIGTIQKFYNEIDGGAKLDCKGVYDAVNKRVMWFYPENGETLINKKNRVLILDIALQAFYPWEISDEASNTSYIVGAEYYPGFGSNYVDKTVVVGANTVVNSALDTVTVTKLSQLAVANSSIVLMVHDSSVGGAMSMALFKGIHFLDWGTATYSSYAEAGYDFLGDLVLKKSSPYIQVYLRPTEEGWAGNPSIGYDPIRPSSLLVSAYWDFRKTVSSNPQQAYRLKFVPVVNPADLTQWDYPDDMVTSRLKLRGTGRSMRLRFESEEGKDFVLLGFGVISAANPRF